MPLSRSMKQMMQDRVTQMRQQARAPRPRAQGGAFGKQSVDKQIPGGPSRQVGTRRQPTFGTGRGRHKPAFAKPAAGPGYGARYAKARAQRDANRNQGATRGRRFGGVEGAMPKGPMRYPKIR